MHLFEFKKTTKECFSLISTLSVSKDFVFRVTRFISSDSPRPLISLKMPARIEYDYTDHISFVSYCIAQDTWITLSYYETEKYCFISGPKLNNKYGYWFKAKKTNTLTHQNILL